MVRTNNDTYQCKECLLWYKEEKYAQACENWCLKHKSCNVEITKRRVK